MPRIALPWCAARIQRIGRPAGHGTKDTRSAQRVPSDRRIAPQTTAWTPCALAVELGSDPSWALSRSKVRKDATNYCRLRLIDLTTTAFVVVGSPNSVAVAEPSTRLALFDTSAKAATRLVGKILKEERIHRTFEAYMKLTDLALRNGDDTNSCEGHLLEERRHVFLIATDTVKCLGEHNVEFSLARPGK